MENLRGILPVVLTVYDEQEQIDYGAYEQQAEWLAATKSAGVGFGYGSDIHRHTIDERLTGLARVADAVKGTLPIYCSVAGSHSTVATVEFALAAIDAGADCLMIPPPSLPSAADDDLFRYYEVIANEVSGAIMVQDAPQHTGVRLSVDLLLRLARDIETVGCIKVEDVPTPPKISAISESLGAGDVSLLGGAGAVEFPSELARGASGTIPGPAFAPVLVEVFGLHTAGETDEARALFGRLLPFLTIGRRSMDTFMHIQKRVLRYHGVIARNGSRSPHERLGGELEAELDELLTDIADLA
ncbi:MAG: dihydrodipicolinate synthase family protein [Acidimicrobiia bacterium]